MNHKIRRANTQDIPQIIELMTEVFGPFSKLDEYLAKWMSQKEYSVFVAHFDNKIIGISTWTIKNDSDLSKYLSFGEKVICFLQNKTTAWILNLAILPQCRRQGIGRTLSIAQLDWLSRQNCEVIAGTSWENGTNDNSQHLYLKSGFKKLGESQEFLRQQLMKSGAICSRCNTSECSCHSYFFGIETDELRKNAQQLHF